MKKAVWILLTFISIQIQLYGQKPVLKTSQNTAQLQKPKLVVGIVVDQMRWDFLYRYYSRYSNNGFKRLLNEGFSCENTMIPYMPTVTAAGHSSIYTGSVPAINGITGNEWWDKTKNRQVYCCEDPDAKTVGAANASGMMSPRNLLVTTVGDELRLSANFRSKVIGIAIKDRGAILPAGHSANAAYWFDTKTGNWISSTYYMQDLPQWTKDFNANKPIDSYYENNWNTLYPIETYNQSTTDEKIYEFKTFGNDQTKFPYNLKQFIGKNYNAIFTSPYGNSLTLDMAKLAIENEKLGGGNETDMLTVSLSSTDIIGHLFGPNSIETEDMYLRLDKDLADFFNFLDNKIGKGQYTLFLTADHGGSHVPGFLRENKIPAGIYDDGKMKKEINAQLREKFGKDSLVVSMLNYQVNLNHHRIDSANLDEKEIIKCILQFVEKKEFVLRAFETSKLTETTLPTKIKEMAANGYNPTRSGDIQIILKPGYVDDLMPGVPLGTSHGVWNPYDAHIPLLWFGWGVKQGKTYKETYMTDIAATLSAILKIQMPNGSIGHVIEEVMK